MMDLLAKQTKALQSIDRLKVTAQSHGKQKKVDSMLHLMSTPKQWELGSGEVQEVHNQFTVRYVLHTLKAPASLQPTCLALSYIAPVE